MKTFYIADTHAVLWYLTADARLGVGARAVLQNPANQIIVPAITVAESLYIIEHGKSSATSNQLWQLVLFSSNVAFYPLDISVLKQSEALTIIPEMHDRQIVATAVCLQDSNTESIVITKDGNITNSGLIKTVW
ncbi:MAG TPA: PIN domain-containing protein [Blastocatellia bacterium]|nr:PIN domain-containing protein [Blastocatellia bacterium]